MQQVCKENFGFSFSPKQVSLSQKIRIRDFFHGEFSNFWFVWLFVFILLALFFTSDCLCFTNLGSFNENLLTNFANLASLNSHRFWVSIFLRNLHVFKVGYIFFSVSLSSIFVVFILCFETVVI